MKEYMRARELASTQDLVFIIPPSYPKQASRTNIPVLQIQNQHMSGRMTHNEPFDILTSTHNRFLGGDSTAPEYWDFLVLPFTPCPLFGDEPPFYHVPPHRRIPPVWHSYISNSQLLHPLPSPSYWLAMRQSKPSRYPPHFLYVFSLIAPHGDDHGRAFEHA